MKSVKIKSTVCEQGSLKVNLQSENGEQFQLSLLPDEVISLLTAINDSLAEVVGHPVVENGDDCGKSHRKQN